MLLASTNDLVQAVTAGTQTIGVYAAWMDINGTAVTPGRLLTPITTATTTTVVASPGAGVQRRVVTLIANNQGSSPEVVSMQITDGTNVAPLISYSFAAGQYGDMADGAEQLLVLASMSDAISVVNVGSGTQALNIYAEWADYDATLSPVVSTSRKVSAAVTTSTTTQAIPYTGLSTTYRNVKFLSIANSGANSETVTVAITDGTSTVTLQSVQLPGGWILQWTSAGGWVQMSNVGALGGYVGAGCVVIRDAISYSGGATQSSVLAIPAGAVVSYAAIDIETAFSAGTTMQLGVAGTAAAFLEASRVTPTQVGIYQLPQETPVSGPLVAQMAMGGSPGAGAGFMIVVYSVPAQ
jgi:hypothetical protein